MSTIKLNKAPAAAGEAPKRQKPVRQGVPGLRDRTQPPVVKNPVLRPDAEQPVDKRPAAAGKPRQQPIKRDVSASGKSFARHQPPAGRSERRPPEAPARKVHVPDPDALPRLSKVMADRGLCSRREADDWIVNGWVKVDGEIVETLGTRIAADAEIVISTYAREHQAETVTILLHKPVGYVSGQAEDGYEPAVVLFTPDNQWSEDQSDISFKRGHLRGLAPAGRLDIDSTGLLVLTQDGRVARKLIGDDSSVEKEYLVRVEGSLSANGLAKLNHGLSLDGVQLKPAKVSWQNEDQLRFVLREGRKRQIRRMCELVGLKVVGLKRIRIGRISLGKLPPGQWRYLEPNERF